MKTSTLRWLPIGVAAITALLLLVALISLKATPASSSIKQNTLFSTWTAAAPLLDGSVDSGWGAAPALKVNVKDGWAGDINVSLKSLYDGDNVYFLIQYADADASLRHKPWQKQADGSWSKVPAKAPGWTSRSEKDPNAANEDKFAMLWNIDNSIAGFNENGCAVLCHASNMRKYTNAPGEKGDIWHFKTVRTGPVGRADDQYVDDCTDAAACAEYGRHSDPKLSGGYSDNKASGGKPSYTSPSQPAPPYYILDAEKQPFSDSYNAGDELASTIISAMTGDRGQLAAGSRYDEASHTWTIEIGRPLVTTSQSDPAQASANDVQFRDLGAAYHFGVAVFDASEVEHSTSGANSYRMVFAGGTLYQLLGQTLAQLPLLPQLPGLLPQLPAGPNAGLPAPGMLGRL